MLLKNLVYLPTLILSIGICLTLYPKLKVSNVYRSFFYFMVTIVAWVGALYVADLSRNATVALYALRAGQFFAAFLPVWFIIFIWAFCGEYAKRRRAMFILLGVGVLVAISNILPWTITSVEPTTYAAKLETAGLGYTIFLVYLIALFGYAFVKLIKVHKHANSLQKLQIKYIFVGSASVLLINIFFAFIFVNQDKSAIAQLFTAPSVMILCVLVTYAIIRHSLFDIRLIVARSVGYILSLGSILFLYGFAIFVLVGSFEHSNLTTFERFSFAVLALASAIVFQPVKDFFNRLTDRIFYRDNYNSQEVLNELGSVLATNIEINTVLSKSAQLINDGLKIISCGFILDAKEGLRVEVFPRETKLPDELLTAIKPLMHKKTNSVFNDSLEERTELQHVLERNQASALLTLATTTDHLGYMVVGIKKSGNVLTSQDQNILNIISNELSIAIQNALRFEEIANFNVTLQQKVNDATKELKKTNEKLKALDEAKDEFISMASHQLRTPLTSVKGYISMILDGDVGQVSPQQKQMLDQAFISSQRMVYLIADLLNVSRLRTGKFVIEATPTYLPDVIEGEIGQLMETAKAKNLELTFDKPKEFPTMNLDETKIRQVIMNFTDNSVYYTPAGGHIKVALEATDKSVTFTVSDDGIGVPKSEQHHLFAKFYRAGNARKARPDGTGLGLFMAKKVVVAQGGAIIFESTEGKGSTFGFTFPRARIESSAADIKSGPHTAYATTPGSGKDDGLEDDSDKEPAKELAAKAAE